MTQRTVLGHRRMLPKERPAKLLVTIEAVIVEGHLAQGAVAETAVGIVAVAAGGFALRDGMSGRQLQLRANRRMTAQALPLGGAMVEGEVAPAVGIVAAVAGNVFLLVRTASPQQLVAPLVATQALIVALCRLGGPAWAEAHVGRYPRASAVVFLTGAVAGGTGGRAAAVERTVNSIEYGVGSGGGIVVAVEAAGFVGGNGARKWQTEDQQ